MINYLQGDIFEAFERRDFNYLIHQTNCVSGANVHGIAKEMFKRYPGALRAHLHNLKTQSLPFFRWSVGDNIINCNSQYYTGEPSGTVISATGRSYKRGDGLIQTCTVLVDVDTFDSRMRALAFILKDVKWLISNKTFGMPLIASKLAADKKLKGNMSDLEYFKAFIAPTVEEALGDCNVYYL